MGSGLRTGWLILGILLLLIVLSEAGLRLALTARDWLLDRPLTEDQGAELTIKKWLQTGADAHQGAEWVRDHYRELILSKGIVPSVQPFIWRPYVYRRRPPFQGRTIQVDRDGLRATWNPSLREGVATGDTRHPPRKAAVADPPPVRLFTFGASTMWGWGARDDYTVASHLSKLLYARGYRVQVTNYGQPSYVGTQETIALLRAIHQGERPDIVLFYDGYSDVMIAASGSDEVGIPHMEDARHGEFGLLDRPRRLREYAVRQLPVEYLWGIGRLAAKLRSGFRPPPDKRPRNRPPGDEVVRQTLHVYAANLAFVASLGRRYGFEPLFYWQPNLFLKRHRSPSERIAAGYLSPFRQAFDAVYRRVRESAVLNDHPGFHDISALFDDLATPYYVDGAHLSEPGNRLVAEAMVDDLIELIERRRAAGK